MRLQAMSKHINDPEHFKDSGFESDGFNSLGTLMPISENLDADDESDSSDMECETENNESNKRTRKGSLSLNHVVFQNKSRLNNRQRKTSCIELYANNKKKNAIDGLYEKTCELPSIKRSMSLPESFENYEMKKVSQGSRSAAARLRLPDIGQRGQADCISDSRCNAKRHYLFLPNITKNDSQNGTVDVQQLNKSEAKKLDLFMRSKFR